MIRGTNAQFKFKIPYDCSDLSLVKITFWQPGNKGVSTSRPLPIIKVLSQCNTTENPRELAVTLNQEETLRFSDKYKAYVQLRASCKDGVTFGNRIKEITVYPAYDDTILEDGILPSPSDDGWIILDGGTIG